MDFFHGLDVSATLHGLRPCSQLTETTLLLLLLTGASELAGSGARVLTTSNKIRPAVASLNLAASEDCPGICTPQGPCPLTRGLKLETLKTPVSKSHECAMLPRNKLEQTIGSVLFDRKSDTETMSSGHTEHGQDV